MWVPWPKYPCCPCSVTMAHVHTVEHYGPDQPEWPRYPWASTYGWHSAGWNQTTGEWYAICHEWDRQGRGHRLTGKTQPLPQVYS